MGDKEYFDYHPAAECEECHALGAYDVYGDFYCGDCVTRFHDQAETLNAGSSQADGFYE